MNAPVSARKRAEEQLEALNAELTWVARSDALTGLPNRRAFDEALEREWLRCARDGSPISLLLLDVDRFKAFNDRYGHPEGDGCLRAVAGAVAGTIRRPSDLAARYGGEEFAIVLPGTDEAGAARVAERVRAAVEVLALPHLGNAACGSMVTASFGCITMRPAQADGGTASLVAAADARLYEAKRLGRNRVCAGMSASIAAALPADEPERLGTLAGYREAVSAEGSDSLDQLARLTFPSDTPMAAATSPMRYASGTNRCVAGTAVWAVLWSIGSVRVSLMIACVPASRAQGPRSTIRACAGYAVAASTAIAWLSASNTKCTPARSSAVRTAVRS